MLKRTEYTLEIKEWDELEKYINGFGYVVIKSSTKAFWYIDNGEPGNTDLGVNSSYAWDPALQRTCSDGNPEGIELAIRNSDLRECIDSFFGEEK